MARSRTTFSSSNNPRKRPVDLDRPAGASAAEIDQILAEPGAAVEQKAPPRDVVGEMAERLRFTTETSTLPYPVPDAGDEPESLDAATAALAEVEVNAAERRAEIAVEHRRIDAAILLAKQAVDRAVVRDNERKRQERARQVAADIIAQDRQRADTRAAEERAERERVEEFRALWRKKAQPVVDEQVKVIDFQTQYEGALLAMQKRTYSRCPASYPHALRQRFDGNAEMAGRLLKQMRDSLTSLGFALSKISTLIKKGPGPRLVRDVAEDGYHEHRAEIADVEQLIGYSRDHYVDLARRMENLMDTWVKLVDEAALYGGAGEQPVPSTQDQRDPVRVGEREYRIDRAQRHPDQHKVVRDGDHAPERPTQQTHAEQHDLP